MDKVSPAFGPARHEVTVTGRDKTGDLLDCSAKVGEHLGQRLEAIVAALAKPYGIGVSVITDTGAVFERFAPNVGDSVGECIERLCRQRGVLAWANGLGNVVIGRGTVGRPVATLRRGDNVEDACNSALGFGQSSEPGFAGKMRDFVGLNPAK